MANSARNKLIMKWLIIALAVLLAFGSILLYLGYLLKQNEQAVTTLIAQQAEIESQGLSLQQSDDVIEFELNDDVLANELSPTKASQQDALLAERHLAKKLNIIKARQIIVEHLTCYDKKQCQLFDTSRIELGCVVAVNQIGYIELNKLPKFNPSVSCEEQISQVSASCRHNICSIE